MIKINIEDLKDLESDFKTFAKRAYPFATKSTINTAAFNTRGETQKNIKEDLINRNRFTANSIRVEQARGLNVSRQEARTGSIAEYFPDIEFGGTTNAPMATTSASGEAENATQRLKLPRRPNKLANINLRRGKRSVKGGKKAQNAARVRSAGRGNRGFVYLDLQRTRGIFKISGSKKKPKIKMIWNLSGKTRIIPAHPVLRPATETVRADIPRIYKQAMEFQARRNKLFGR